MLPDLPKTAIIIPCYNETNRLDAQRIVSFLRSNTWLHLCFVNDGSTDSTRSLLGTLMEEYPSNVSIIDLPQNVGKAEAVRRGMTVCHETGAFEFIGFMDADLATPLGAMEEMLRFEINHKKAIMLTGCRVRRLGASINRNGWRHLLGRSFATAASMVLKLPLYDTQCGAKLFRSVVVGDIFKEPFLSRWFFDVELFARMVHLYGREGSMRLIVEFPLNEWHEIKGSKLNWSQFLRAPLALMKIYFAYRKKDDAAPLGPRWTGETPSRPKGCAQWMNP